MGTLNVYPCIGEIMHFPLPVRETRVWGGVPQGGSQQAKTQALPFLSVTNLQQKFKSTARRLDCLNWMCKSQRAAMHH